MIEISNINPVRKGALLATCSVRIAPWKITLHEVKIFEKGLNRWIVMPAREYMSNEGTKKYIELLSFDTEAVKNRFRDQIMAAVDKYLESNPDLQPEDVIKTDGDVPF